MNENKENRINTVFIFDNIKHLTVGRMYCSSEVVLGRECLQHIRNIKDKKKSELILVMKGHKKSYEKIKLNIIKIVDIYNKKRKTVLTNLRSMKLVVYVQLIRST